MQKPKHVSGWCPHYDEPSGLCYLSEVMPSSGTYDYNCKSDKNCKTYSNYEAWKSSRNYTTK